MVHTSTRVRRAPAIGLILALIGAPVAVAQFQLFDDFEDKTPGPISGQDGWVAWSAGIVAAVDPADPFNQVLLVPSNSSILRKSLGSEGINVPDLTQRMTFMRLRVARKQTFSLGLSPFTSPDEYSDFANEIGMANGADDLNLRVWDEDIGHYQEVAQLEPDRWYNLWCILDTYTNTYRLWLNEGVGRDAEASDALSAPDGHATFAFRTGTNSDLVTFYLKTSGGASDPNDGPIYLDDIYVEAGTMVNLTNPAIDACPPDVNNDGVLNFFDALLFLDQFASGDDQADVNGDGAFDFFDVQMFLASFSAGC
ncbi:MAG: hypothetical protein KJZ65_01440 [Phycisphaerales bacterium]|nr:hypothetical protein [Phycisphaerales bacterium]